MHATLEAVLTRTEIASDLSVDDRQLARRIAGEWMRFGVGALARSLFEGPSGRRLARAACEDVEGIRRMADCFAEREITIQVTEEIEEPAVDEGSDPVKKIITREEIARTPPRVIEIADGPGMPSLVAALTWPDRRFVVREDDDRRRWLWNRMCASFGLRNVDLLPVHSRIAPGEWDIVLVKDTAPTKAMDMAGSLLAEGGDLLLWQDRRHAKGLRRRHLDARSRPLRLAAAAAMESPVAQDRLVARIHSPLDGLDAAGEQA